jgi:hypothetical protein
MKHEQEPVVVFFRRYNKSIFVLASFLLVALVGTQWYLNAKERDLRLSSENFESLREAYVNWTKVLKSSDLKTTSNRDTVDSIFQKMKTLRVSLQQGVTPYPEIARLYETLEIVSSGRADELGGVEIDLPLTSDPTGVEGRLVLELQGLVIAKSLANRPELRAKGLALLKTLVQRGSVVSVAALSSLAGLAATDQEKRELIAMIPGVLQQQPWQQVEIDKVAQRIKLAEGPG